MEMLKLVRECIADVCSECQQKGIGLARVKGQSVWCVVLPSLVPRPYCVYSSLRLLQKGLGMRLGVAPVWRVWWLNVAHRGHSYS